MINKVEILNGLIKDAFVLVLRTDTKEEGISIANAAIKGGCNVVEVTFTIPNANEVIAELSKNDKEDAIIGAGTVLDSETARIAILAGAKFIVSPSFNRETSIICNRYGIPYIPGCFSVREVVEAREYGSDIVKLFPGSAFKPSIIKDIKAPIKGIGIMVSGGISYDNMSEWVSNGCDIISIGSSIVNLKDPVIIEKETRKYIERIDEIKN
jgi:2-dehydro-3-deoxyphosphogluconate aldolase / (4S)-4-hydroxy-2-oxoglutarate aldolase